MTIKKVEHPLRTIVLNYDETKTLLAFEEGLLKEYIKLHDDTYTVYQQGSRLIYEYQAVEPEIGKSAKAFAPIEISINEFLNELRYTKDKNDTSIFDDEDFTSRMIEYNVQINDFHQNILLPMSYKVDELDEEFKEFETKLETLNDNLETYDDEIGNEIYTNYENASLDLTSYDEDLDDLHGIFDKLNSYQNEKEKFIDKYNLNMNWINKVYSEAKQMQVIINEVKDEEGLLDSSISDNFANGLLENNQKPIYFVDPTDESVKDFKNTFGGIATTSVHTIDMEVDSDVIESGEIRMICNFISGLQHYPKLIEKSIFSIKINIVNKDGILLEENQWKGYPQPMNWFFKLSGLPISLFFLEDRDARAYVLMGDYFAEGNVEGDGEMVELKGKMLEDVINRLFQACYFFMVYCHNTGFDPISYIEAVLADFDLPITYEHVKERFEADLLLGIHVRVSTRQKEE